MGSPGVIVPLGQPSNSNTDISSQTQTLVAGTDYNSSQQGVIAPLEWNINGYTFDAWLRLHHSNSSTITQHPVEFGSTISDYIYTNQKRFSFEIGTSDSMPISSSDVLTPTKSIGTYTLLVDLMEGRSLLTLRSKYGYFTSVLIESIEVSDDYRTTNAMIASVNLIEIIMANTEVGKVSINPQSTDQTNRGQVQLPSISATFQKLVTDIAGLAIGGI